MDLYDEEALITLSRGSVGVSAVNHTGSDRYTLAMDRNKCYVIIEKS